MRVIAGTELGKYTEELASVFLNANLTVVIIEDRYTPNSVLQDCGGLLKALEIVNERTPIILTGWQTPPAYASRPEWHALLGYPHVSFYRLPFPAYEEMKEVVEKALAGSGRPADPLAILLLKAESRGNSMGILRHDLKYVDDHRRGAWLQRARLSLGDYPEEELIRMVQNDVPPTLGPLAGQEFPDVCVDVEGTLLDANGNLRQEVVQKVLELSTDRPVTIWTGGETVELGKKLREHRLPWKLASKQTLRGAKVHAIIDDLAQPEFTQTYNVDCDVYVQV